MVHLTKKHENLLNALKEIEEKCSTESGRFGLTKVLRKHNSYSPSIVKVIKDSELIINNGTTTNPKFKWNTIMPNIKMVIEILKKTESKVHTKVQPEGQNLEKGYKCKKCGKIKPKKDFHRMKASKNGLNSYCKDCRAEVYRKKGEDKKEKVNAIGDIGDLYPDYNICHICGTIEDSIIKHLHYGGKYICVDCWDKLNEIEDVRTYNEEPKAPIDKLKEEIEKNITENSTNPWAGDTKPQEYTISFKVPIQKIKTYGVYGSVFLVGVAVGFIVSQLIW